MARPSRWLTGSGRPAVTAAMQSDAQSSAGCRSGRSVELRVCESGDLALCGLSRFPVTLSKAQWIALLDMRDDIRAFIADHEGLLKPAD